MKDNYKGGDILRLATPKFANLRLPVITSFAEPWGVRVRECRPSKTVCSIRRRLHSTFIDGVPVETIDDENSFPWRLLPPHDAHTRVAEGVQ